MTVTGYGLMIKEITKWIQQASPQFEFCFVILVAFGYPAISALSVMNPQPRQVVMTGEDLVDVVLYEVVIALILGWFLFQRGWTLKQFSLRPSWKSSLVGIGLIPLIWLIYGVVWYSLVLLFPELEAISRPEFFSATAMQLWQIILISIVNPIFEEIFVCGYVINFTQRLQSVWLGVEVSVCIRTLYHLYQPINGVVAIIIVGLVFGTLYARTNRLWPIVLAHGLLDLLPLLRLYYN
jgi:uncharacterized protein